VEVQVVVVLPDFFEVIHVEVDREASKSGTVASVTSNNTRQDANRRDRCGVVMWCGEAAVGRVQLFLEESSLASGGGTTRT
jgi:hypothetical protein